MRRSSSESRRFFPALDGLRALAVLAVIWHHSTPQQLQGWLGRGHLGVQLFFCISGFLITTLLLDERREKGGIRLGQFWWRRALRILPLYYAVLALFVAHAALLPESPMRQHFFASLPAFASGTTTWFVSYRVPHPVLFGFSWSLATELQFYLIWPLLLVWTRTPRQALVALFTLIVFDQAAERGLVSSFLAPRGFYAGVIKSFSTSLGLGAAMALAVADPKFGPWLVRGLARRGTLWVLGLLAAALVVWPREPFALFELVLASLVASAALAPSSHDSPLRAAPLAHVGRLSYSMYLFHVPIIGVVRQLLPGLSAEPLVVFPLALALSVAAAEFSARWLERPLMAHRNPPQLLPRFSRVRTSVDVRGLLSAWTKRKKTQTSSAPT